MIGKEFKEQNVIIAKEQKEYNSLPAYYNPDESSLTVCFELTENEVNRIKATNELWLKFKTFGQPLQPIFNSCLKEELIKLGKYRLKRELVTSFMELRLPALVNAEQPLSWWEKHKIVEIDNLERCDEH